VIDILFALMSILTVFFDLPKTPEVSQVTPPTGVATEVLVLVSTGGAGCGGGMTVGDGAATAAFFLLDVLQPVVTMLRLTTAVSAIANFVL
jgi:hypothetical protein